MTTSNNNTYITNDFIVSELVELEAKCKQQLLQLSAMFRSLTDEKDHDIRVLAQAGEHLAKDLSEGFSNDGGIAIVGSIEVEKTSSAIDSIDYLCNVWVGYLSQAEAIMKMIKNRAGKYTFARTAAEAGSYLGFDYSNSMDCKREQLLAKLKTIQVL